MTVMEWIGTVAFAVSGAVVAIEHKLDYYGICVLAITTAIGGGIIRDVIAGKSYPVSLEDPSYAACSIVVAVIVMLFWGRAGKLKKLYLIADAIGLAAFTVIGATVAVKTGHDSLLSVVFMAVLTGTFGGVLRDVMVCEIPVSLRREVYAVATMAGAVSFYVIHLVGSWKLASYICFCVTLALRLTTLKYDVHLGVVGENKK